MNGHKLASLTGVTLTIFLIAACSGGSETPDAAFDAPTVDARPVIDADTTDARPADLSCIGTNPTPPVVPAQIDVAGEVQKALPADPVDMAQVSAYLRSDPNNAAATDTTAADGLYALSITTGNSAWDGYLKGTAPNLIDSYLYPAAPLTDHIADADMIILTEANRNLFTNAASLTLEAGTAIMAVAIQDCNGDPIIGATVTVSPAGNSTLFYATASTSLPSQTLTATDESGFAIAFNVPNTGVETTITVDYQGTQIVNAATAWADSIVAVQIQAQP